MAKTRSAGKTIVRAASTLVLLITSGQGATGQTWHDGSEVVQSQVGSLSHPSMRSRDGQAGQNKLLRSVDGALDEIERMIRDAYYRTALGMVDTRRGRLAELGLVSALDSRRARLEVLAATAEVALDQRVDAMRSMRRALRADPGMILDEQQTPPKVYSLLREARLGRTFRNTR